MKINAFLTLVLCTVCLNLQILAGDFKNLTIYDAGVAEVTEERTIELQTGINQITWRSLMPSADLRTVRVTVENAQVVRQDVTFDGADVKNQKTPVLHLVVENKGAAGARRVLVDYLAPNMSWDNNYAMVLDTAAVGAPPTSARLDSWFSVFNNTGIDLNADSIDLIAGEISLIKQNQSYNEDSNYTAQYNVNVNTSVSEVVTATAPTSQFNAFSRFRIGSDLSLTANKTVSRFPLFQQAKLQIVQRNAFENEYNAQTVGRNGFVLLPRGLAVRLVGTNPTRDAMPAGVVTVYSKTPDGFAQVVGQDRIQLTPPNGDFTVSQGRSSTLFGTRRILDRRVVNFKDEDGDTEDKLVTKIEITLTNRSSQPAEAFVREGIENYDDNQWEIAASSIAREQWERLGTNSMQTKITVPANGKITINYTVECR